jgi:2-dehydropantoate 2-reductase
MRSDFAHVKRHGLRLLSKQGDVHLQGLNCYETAEAIGPCDLVIIALKNTANAVLETVIPPLLHADTMLLTLQNGLGNEEFLASLFGAERVLGGLCQVCLNRTGPGVVAHLAHGAINLGEYSGWPQPRTHEVAAELKRCGITCTVEESLRTARWRKLVWNIPFNGLSIVAGGLHTAAILADPALLALLKSLMHEVVGAARSLGCELSDTVVEDMIRATQDITPYRTSSLIDYDEGRAVELEAIWGEPLRQAQSAGAPSGRMEMLYQLLHSKVRLRPGSATDSP